MFTIRIRFVLTIVCSAALFQLRSSGGNPGDVIEKASVNLKDGSTAVLLMFPSRDDKKTSATHRLVVRVAGASDETVWETEGKDRSPFPASIDVDNDWVQLAGARLDGDSLSFLLSTALGVDLIRLERKRGNWVQTARGSIFFARERFTSLEIPAQGIVYASASDGDYLILLDAEKPVRRFREAQPRPDGAPREKPESVERSWIIWTGASDETRTEHTPDPSVPTPVGWSAQRAKAGDSGEAVFRIDADGATRRFNRFVDPPQAPVVHLQPPRPSDD